MCSSDLMLISSVSDMSRRSRAVRLVAFGKDTMNVIGFLASAQSAQAYQAIPLYDVKGSVSQFDENLIKNQKVIARPLPDAVVKALRDETTKVLAEAVAKDPMTKKVHESYMAFKAKYDRWSEVSEEAYHIKVRG